MNRPRPAQLCRIRPCTVDAPSRRPNWPAHCLSCPLAERSLHQFQLFSAPRPSHHPSLCLPAAHFWCSGRCPGRWRCGPSRGRAAVSVGIVCTSVALLPAAPDLRMPLLSASSASLASPLSTHPGAWHLPSLPPNRLAGAAASPCSCPWTAWCENLLLVFQQVARTRWHGSAGRASAMHQRPTLC